ncbi:MULTISPECIES: S4 domain-containing protein YaaA [Allobacillus]|uniref:S4 domain-containing protein YaaA n=1 Tax=Allobacillus halotolerans TaxID=570278 RepID=A0ABS6GME9_9BACI|nr:MULTISPECIES: S4 domain-containing protein YaaA [Allobacillus]MBU6080066.1 S4 domain-containing protein YaaA [Allobacillus halotolerans]TSJ65581.1 S4 domain-containing protein YaaA [Allobacillus sp. SKP2-8]
MAEPIEITTEQITLGQFLKLANIVESGGMVKLFLTEFAVYINDEQDQRRGRKLKPGDLVEIQGVGSFEVTKSSE